MNGVDVDVVTSGDGLYADTYEGGRYVYKGADPNNYITLGGYTLRIISKESDGTLKVMLLGDLGGNDFDSLNGRYSTTGTDYCNYPNNGCSVWGSKTTMLNSSGNNVTTMPRKIGGTEHNLPDEEASLNTYLNNDWYKSLDSDVRNKITTHMFNVGLVSFDDTSLIDTISSEQAYKWNGKIGLINASDYVKASTNSVCTSVNAYYNDSNCYGSAPTDNWIFISGGFTDSWTITPSSVNDGISVFCGHSDGSLVINNAYGSSRSVFPVFYLSSSINLSGSGTSSDPFTVS